MPGASWTVAEQQGLRDAARGGPASAVPPASAAVSAGVTRTFARRAEEVPVARRFIRDTLADHPASMDAELLACELVTNAVQHATDAARVTVAVTRCGPGVHVDVTDDGRTGLPHWRQADGHDEDGRGFQLVNEIAQRWGFLREPAGTCVWFELTRLACRGIRADAVSQQERGRRARGDRLAR
jgi:anti-sigma regulatory factor (Ser/Thr protein kinase)